MIIVVVVMDDTQPYMYYMYIPAEHREINRHPVQIYKKVTGNGVGRNTDKVMCSSVIMEFPPPLN